MDSSVDDAQRELEGRLADLTAQIHIRRLARLQREDLLRVLLEAPAEESARDAIRELLGVSTNVAQALLDLPMGSIGRFEIDRLERERSAIVAALRGNPTHAAPGR